MPPASCDRLPVPPLSALGLPEFADFESQPARGITYPARGDRPHIGAVDANRDPWAGDPEGLGGEGTVATVRAWISPGSIFRPVDVDGPSQGVTSQKAV